jgi:FtsP/CotA-like multicopper oxidase with cupredoxin domain
MGVAMKNTTASRFPVRQQVIGISVLWVAAIISLFVSTLAFGASFRVQCPSSTKLHPNGSVVDPKNPGLIKCQEIAGSDGYATMGDGHQIYLFGFGPLSGTANIQQGLPGTAPATNFNNPSDPNSAMFEPAAIMNNGVLAANAPAPMMAIDEDDEFFLTLSNVGMIMRPDLFEQHTVHFHGYPNASSFFDGVPDASVAINIAGSFTYYYTAPDAGTYFWHCHITPPEHLQMGMVGQLYVRPRQNKVPVGSDLRTALQTANQKAALPTTSTYTATDGVSCSDILCTGQTPLPATTSTQTANAKYAYNDGDGSTRYDVEYPIQLMGFDPNFHYVGMTFNPEAFADMKDKYFLISGRSYPDTVYTNFDNTNTVGLDGKNPVPNGPMATLSSDGISRPSQPQHTLISLRSGQRALLRISDLNVTEFHTLATVGIPMLVIADNARLLRDMAGNNLYYKTNSITLGGGESADVILDTAGVPAGTYFLYTTNLDHLSNDAENFGGMMTEIVVN